MHVTYNSSTCIHMINAANSMIKPRLFFMISSKYLFFSLTYPYEPKA